jgi:hypothetical protein
MGKVLMELRTARKVRVSVGRGVMSFGDAASVWEARVNADPDLADRTKEFYFYGLAKLRQSWPDLDQLRWTQSLNHLAAEIRGKCDGEDLLLSGVRCCFNSREGVQKKSRAERLKRGVSACLKARPVCRRKKNGDEKLNGMQSHNNGALSC